MSRIGKLAKNQNDAKPYFIVVDTGRGFWQQVSTNYVTTNGALRWAKNHDIEIVNVR